MHYTAIVRREGRHWLADFPDCPGCQTFSVSQTLLDREEALALPLDIRLGARRVA
jgi:hypothetical protein